MFKGLLIYVKIKRDLQGDVGRIYVALPVIIFLLILHKIYECFMQNHLVRFAKLSGVLQKSKQKIWRYMLSHGFYADDFSDYVGSGDEYLD